MKPENYRQRLHREQHKQGVKYKGWNMTPERKNVKYERAEILYVQQLRKC